MGMTLKKRPSSAARLRAILDQAPLGIALTDSLTGRIQDVNACFATITGRKRKDLLGLAWMPRPCQRRNWSSGWKTLGWEQE